MADEPKSERQSEHPSPMHRMPSHEEEEKESGCCRCGSGRPSDQMVKPTNPDPAQIQRKCTDVLCILLLIACWVVMTGIGVVSIQNGNPRALVSPTDYKGRICGVDHGVVNKPYGYYIDSYLNMVCLDECPSATQNITGAVSAYEAMICIDDDVEDAYKTATKDDTEYYYGYSNLFNDGTGPCNFELETYTVLYYCIFSPTATIPSIKGVDFPDEGESILKIADVDDESMSSNAFMEFVQDVITTRNYIFGFGFAVAFLTSFFYSWLMTKGMIHLLVWVCIMMSEALMLALGAYMYYTGTEWESDDEASTHSDTEINGMKGLGIAFLSIAGLFFCFICCNCSKIRKCCNLVQTAGQAVRDVPITVFFPIIQTGGLVIFMVPWMYYMVAANAQGEYVDTTVSATSTTNSTNEVWVWSETDQYCNTFLMFSYFWTSQFITALGQLVMALTFAKWYFTEDPPVDTDAPAVGCCRKCWCGVPHAYRGNGLFFSALKAGLWYHAGTAAAGSLIIAIIKTIRYLISKVQYYCEKSTSGAAKRIAQVVLCCIQCCLYCVEKCMKFINKHAYIITAVKGLGFCAAAVDAFWLIARNITMIASMTLIQEFVMIIGKIAIVSATGASSYIVMEEVFDDTEVNSYVGPVLFVMVLAYFIADMFMVTYSMAIDTVMHCYIADKEMYGSETNGAFCTRPGCSHLAKISELIKNTAAEDKVVEEDSETTSPIN